MKYRLKALKTSLKNKLKHKRFKKIVCLGCGKEQALAVDWDYQRCECGEYLYDYR